MSADQPLTAYQIERPGARTITLKLTPGAALDWERAGNTVTPVDELAGPQYHGTTAQEVATILAGVPASDGTDIQVPTTSDVPTPPQAQDAPDAVPDPAPARGRRRKPKPAAPVEDVPVEDTDW